MRAQNRRNINVSVAFTITAPAGARVTARSVSGSVGARDLRASSRSNRSAATSRFVNGKRVVSAKSISGNVEVTGADTDGSIDASSVSGAVAVRKTKARRVSLADGQRQRRLDDVAASVPRCRPSAAT